ncbi:hypothetical protein TL16_g10424 [Triparma laevis f. inornata]|uniref:Translin-associated factor X-interacting protein 1 N-terminal domain-containing protein n=1 Tax=Triparma laevis f. inornata TaxID=1714386 RepID=A0A9W7EMD2_9STRA|nr:hypothetical protein TL16_g10424 [Triparma laevis f. inornata]
MLDAKPNISRIKVFRAAFSIFANEFKSYSNFLNSIRNEYDSLISSLSSQLHGVPAIQAEIASLRIGASQKIEDLKREHGKERKESNDKLRAQYKMRDVMERENKELRETVRSLDTTVNMHKEKHDELKSSTVTLTHALVRLEDENSARALVENTQQSEVLRLKGALEKANAEVDRLKHMSVDMEEQVANLVPPQVLEEKEAHIGVLRKEMSQMRSNYRALEAKYKTLNGAVSRTNVEQGDSAVSSAAPGIRVSNVIVDDLVNQIEKLKAELDEGKASSAQNQEDEMIELEKHHPEGNFFEGRGCGEDVPEFLRYDGLLRNWRLSKRECERAVNDIWIAKEEWAEDNPDDHIHLSDFIFIYLQEKYEENQALVAEFGYNLIDALERYIADSDCKIFLKILQGELAEEVRDDQLQLLMEIPRVMEDEDCNIHSGIPTGSIQVPIFMRRLRKMLTTKSEHSFSKLQKALLFEAKKGRNVPYNDLFEEDEDGNQGDFCELLRAQHLEEIIAFDKKLVDAITDAANKEGVALLPLSTLRAVLQHADQDKARADINLYLARGANCTIQEVVEKENNGERFAVSDFIPRLRDGLLKKSEAKS